MTQSSETLKELQQSLPGRVLVDDASRFKASLDNLRLSVLPEAVIQPASEDDIAVVLRLANRDCIPVTPRGAGSATTGAATPIRGGWVLDLGGWRALVIDRAAGLAYAQPGVTIEELESAAAAKGWFYPPDPGSKKYATVGGTIATNAGGMRGAKYGVTRDYVMALEGFLPTGEWVRWGADLRKFASGLNIRDLWIGSEGALGVITGAVLRLIPKPRARATILAAYPEERAALRVVRKILQARLNPSVLEFLDRQTISCTLRRLEQDRSLPRPPAAFPKHPMAVLLVECDGHPAAVAEDCARLQTYLAHGAAFVKESRSPRGTESLWSLRRTCSQAMFQMGDSKLNEDVVVPLGAQEDLIRMTLEVRAKTGLATPTFGHAADGNFHVHIMFNRSEPEHLEKAEQAITMIMERVVALGGAITGEHGIGLAKSPFLALQHSPSEIAAMQTIKRALDPNDILNPGKQFEPFRVWEHPVTKARLPWDH